MAADATATETRVVARRPAINRRFAAALFERLEQSPPRAGT
jgi:hypothetical protein